jgi:hypothetical protein
LSAEEMVVRLAQRAFLECARERDARERASRCGMLASFDGFESALVERLQETIR